MERSGRLAVALALGLMMAAPALPMVGAQGTPPGGGDKAADAANPTRPVTFFPHVFEATAFQPMPGNTQFPWGEDDFSAGYPDFGCFPEAGAALYGLLPALPGVPLTSNPGRITTCDQWENNVLYVYSTAGFVNADPDTWSYEQFHNERGQSKDIFLDTTQSITATFYMSADWHGWGFCGTGPAPGVPWPVPCWNWDPGYYPGWTVEATFYLGNMGDYQGQASEAPPVHEKVASGDVILVGHGVSAPQDMLSLDSSLPGGKGEVYEFNIDLGPPQVDRIPKEMDWVMEFRWYASAGDQTFTTRLNWNLNTGEQYPARFVLPVKNPFDVELVLPRFLHDKLLILGLLNSPWGSYDVDARTVELTIKDDRQQSVEPQTIHRVADFSVAHGGHYKPVNITWVWDYRADKLEPGAYTATVHACNYQHSACTETTAKFQVNADRSGTVLDIGRSGQRTFTEDQVRDATRDAARGGGGP